MMTLKPSSLSNYPLLLLFFSIFSSYSSALSSDGLFLLSFKYTILSDPLHILDTWNYDDNTPCSWRGVSCIGVGDSTPTSNRVVSLSLPNSQLMGSLPPDLGYIEHLQTLNLSNNFLNGSLPDSLFNLSELRQMDLSINSISGRLSGRVCRMVSLEYMNLSENNFTGNIPANLTELGNLTVVSLRKNYFTGRTPGGFNRVRVLDLSSNLINGSLPLDFDGRRIQTLNVSYNRISGQIPPEFPRRIPENATLDFSFNNLTGGIPSLNSNVFLNQKTTSFTGNDLCGPPLNNPCPIPASPTSPPAIAAIPKTFHSPANEASSPENEKRKKKQRGSAGFQPHTIVAIVVGDIAGVAIIAAVFIYICRKKTKNARSKRNEVNDSPASIDLWSTSSSSPENKSTIAKWACLRKKNSEGNKESTTEDSISKKGKLEEDRQSATAGTLVTVDGGEKELEVETLLKAAAYILGASGSGITYKAVLEDGTVLAVRRLGDSGVERLKEFEGQVRSMAKLNHPNLVRVRGFYWGPEEKLVIYEFVPNGNLANARYRKTGSSPMHVPWEIRIRIAKGVARGLAYLHEKKHVHGNLKPSNILLDMNFEPKIGDFGLDRLTMGRSGYIIGGSTQNFGSKRSTASRDSFQDVLAGATPSPSASSIGCVSPYQSPESLRSLKPTPKWDVYSYGVVLLELLTGKVMVLDDFGPPVMAGLMAEDKIRILRMADGSIRAELEGKEDVLLGLVKLGYNCVSHVPQKRPSMKEVLQVLEKIPSNATNHYSSSNY